MIIKGSVLLEFRIFKLRFRNISLGVDLWYGLSDTLDHSRDEIVEFVECRFYTFTQGCRKILSQNEYSVSFGSPTYSKTIHSNKLRVPHGGRLYTAPCGILTEWPSGQCTPLYVPVIFVVTISIVWLLFRILQSWHNHYFDNEHKENMNDIFIISKFETQMHNHRLVSQDFWYNQGWSGRILNR